MVYEAFGVDNRIIVTNFGTLMAAKIVLPSAIKLLNLTLTPTLPS